MDARNELIVYLGASLATVVGLFAVQLWYESYLDVSVVHAQHLDEPPVPALRAVRAAEHDKLTSGKLPIDQAISALSQRGRAAFPKIAPKPSEDLSAMSGWIHKPGFMPYEPRRPIAPVAAPASAAPADGSAAEGAPAAGTEVAPTPAAQGAAAPAAQGVAAPAAAAAPTAAAVPAVAGPTAPEAPAAGAAERSRLLEQRVPVQLRPRQAPPARTPAHPAP